MSDNRDPAVIGKMILERPDKKEPAHVAADRILTNGSKNGKP